MECRVEFDYVAQEPDELTIKKGEIIKNVVTKMDGWFEGTLRGKTGVFPDNFVKLIEKPTPEISAEKTRKISEDVVILRNNPHSARRVKVLFSYNPEQDDELALEVGDVLEFIEEVEEGWWRGRLKGKEGIFPSNFVSEIDEPKANGGIDGVKPNDSKTKDTSRNSHPKGIPDVVPATPPSQPNIDDEPAPELPPKPVRELARCFYPYKALNDDELTLSEGDIVTIISRTCEDEGWWRGELRGKIGLFPDNFVKIITPGEVHPAVGSGGPQPKILAQERNVAQVIANSSAELPAKAKKDSIASGTVVDGGGFSKSLDKDKSMDSPSSKIEQAKAKLSKTNSKEAQVPVPKVGHVATSPISPGIAAFHSNLFSKPEAGKKEPPPVPKDDKGDDESEEFNSVERTEILNHLTANRAKAPKRRPPSTIITRENDIVMMNGSSHSYEDSVADSPPPHHSTPMNNSITSNGTPSGSYIDGGGNSMNHSGSFLSQSKEGSPTPSSANKPKKQALPWMAELKQTQDKKRGLVSPVANAPSTGPPSLSTSATAPAVTNTSTSSPSPQPQQPSFPTVHSTPKEPTAIARAPPLPAKPSSLHNTTGGGSEKPAATPLNHSTSLNNSSSSPFGVGSNKSYTKKSPSPAPPAPTTNHNSSSDSHQVHHRGDGDSNSNKGFVTYEEYAALKTRVTSLENEVETLKRQIKLLLDRDLRGHIV